MIKLIENKRTKFQEILRKIVREILLEAEDNEDELEDDDEENLEDENPGDEDEPGTDKPEDEPANPPGSPNNPNPTQTPSVFTASNTQMADLIRKTKGKFFTVEFVKRMTGTNRVMNARLGVKAYLHGGVLPYDPNEKNLIPCFDMQKHDYRMIAIEGIKSLKIGKNIYILPGTPIKEILFLKEEYRNQFN